MVSIGLWGDIRLSCGGEFSLSLNETCISPTYHFLITKYTTHVDASYRNTGFQSLSYVGDTHGSSVKESFLFHWKKTAYRPYALQRVGNVLKSRLGTNTIQHLFFFHFFECDTKRLLLSQGLFFDNEACHIYCCIIVKY